MDEELLRFIHRKRFMLMNRWHGVAKTDQPTFGSVSGCTFRSFIFKAFDDLAQLLRRGNPAADDAGLSLLEQMDLPVAFDGTPYLRTLETGIDVLERFLREDPDCCARFPKRVREKACGFLKETGAVLLEREFRVCRRRVPPEQRDGFYCARCGRPVESAVPVKAYEEKRQLPRRRRTK